MAPAPTTSAFIPPPPLPEYYQKTPKVIVTVKTPEKEEAASRTQSAKTDMQALVVKTKTTPKEKPSKQDITTTHTKAQIGIPTVGDAIDARMLTPPMTKFDVPPLAVYHICRICLRPRSNRYHREHPIPVNGVPPPPGICRRCRVKKVEEKGVVEEDVVEVVKLRDERPGCPNLFHGGESNEMRVGLRAFILDPDVVSAETASRRRDREVLRKLERGERLHKVQEVHEESSEDEEETRRIRYRHVYVRERSVSANPQPAAADVDEAPLPKPKTSASSTAQDAIDAVSLLSQEPVMTTATAAAASMQVQPTDTQQALTTTQAPPTIEVIDADTVNVKTGRAVSSKASSSASYPVSRSETKASVHIMESSQPRFTESDIRRLAREEVVKFRHAERKLEAHPDAYAHGRLVPVARRIEKSRDVKEPRPWEEVEIRVVNQSESGQKVSLQAAHAGFIDRDVNSEHVSQRSKRSTADNRSGEHTSTRDKPSSEPKSQPQHSHTGRRDFAYEADSHTYSASRGLKMGSERVTERSASQHEAPYRHSGAEGQIHKGREVLVEYERVYRPGSKSNKSPQALQETKQSFRGDSSGLNIPGPTTGFSSKPLPPESDPPVSVKMREVLSWDPTQRFEAGDPWQEPPIKHNVKEVIQEVEQPRLTRSRTDSRVSERVREPTDGADREERATSVRSSRYSESGYLDGNSATKTASRQTSRVAEDAKVMDDEDSGGGGARKPASGRLTPSQKSQTRASFRDREEVEDDKTMWPGSSSSRSGLDQGEGDGNAAWTQVSVASRQSGNESFAAIQSRPRAFDRRMAAVRQQEAGSREVAASASEQPTRPGTQQLRDSQPLRDDEYICVRRVTRPLNDDEERVSHDDLPAKHRTYVDRFFRESFEPIGNGPTRKDGRPTDHWIEMEERLESGKNAQGRSLPAQQHTSVARLKDEDSRMSKKSVRQASSAEVQPSRAQQQRRHYRRETKGSPSSTSTRVRFASKVEVSPTPPGSDASSTQFRIIGPRGASKKLVDGESGEDLIAEYENRGRTRVRRDRRHHEPIEEEGSEYYYEKKQSATPDAPQRKDAINRWDGVDDSQYQPRKSRPLHRALSESPSRERLTETFGGSAKTIELAGAYEHREPWHATVETIEREGSGRW